MTRSEALACAAGLFEVRGKISITRPSPTTVYLVLSMKSVDHATVDRFRSLVGYGCVYGPYRNKGRSPHYVYRAHGFELPQAILVMLWPWFNDARRSETVAALQCHRELSAPLADWRLKLRRNGQRLGGPRRARETRAITETLARDPRTTQG